MCMLKAVRCTWQVIIHIIFTYTYICTFLYMDIFMDYIGNTYLYMDFHVREISKIFSSKNLFHFSLGWSNFVPPLLALKMNDLA